MMESRGSARRDHFIQLRHGCNDPEVLALGNHSPFGAASGCARISRPSVVYTIRNIPTRPTAHLCHRRHWQNIRSYSRPIGEDFVRNDGVTSFDPIDSQVIESLDRQIRRSTFDLDLDPI